jgi:3-dehydroquinate synthase
LQIRALPATLRAVETITVALGDRSYPIHIGGGSIGEGALYGARAKQLLVVTNDVVAPLYLDAVRGALGPRDVEVLVLPDGEREKTLATFARILDRLVEARFHRDCCPSRWRWRRGRRHRLRRRELPARRRLCRCPPRCCSVDSSVGGKTAVNHPRQEHDRRVHQPIAVIADTPRCARAARELAAGLARSSSTASSSTPSSSWLEANIAKLRALDPKR